MKLFGGKHTTKQTGGQRTAKSSPALFKAQQKTTSNLRLLRPSRSRNRLRRVLPVSRTGSTVPSGV